jgi:hypothetical protein
MSNIMTDIGHDVKVAAVDTAHVAEKIVGAIPKAIAVLTTALKDEPAVKAAVVALVQAGSKVIADGAIAVAAKGVNLPEDIATVVDAESFVQYFAHTFVPAVSACIKEVEADIK